MCISAFDYPKDQGEPVMGKSIYRNDKYEEKENVIYTTLDGRIVCLCFILNSISVWHIRKLQSGIFFRTKPGSFSGQSLTREAKTRLDLQRKQAHKY